MEKIYLRTHFFFWLHRLYEKTNLHLRLRPPPNPLMLLTPWHQMIHNARIHQRRPRLPHIRDAHQPHTRLQLILQNLTQMHHPLPPIAQTVQKRSPDPHRRRPQRKRLQYIRPARDAPIDVHFAPVEDVGAETVQL